MKNKNNLHGWLILILLSLIWGSSFILIKKGLLAFNYVQVGALRIILSGIAVAPFAYRYRKHINRKNIGGILGTAILGSGIPPFLFAIAQTNVSSSLVGIINTLTPLFTFIIGVFMFGAKFQKNKIVGVIIGLGGALTIILFAGNSNISSNPYYGFYIVLATICYANSVNIIKKYLDDTNAAAITSYSFLLILIPALIIFSFTDPLETFRTEPHFWYSLGAMALLSFVGTAFANFLFFNLTQKTNTLFASSVTYIIPIVALFWGLLDGETINMVHLIGMGLIFIGVWITSKKS